jgi:hypothetical protein
MGAQLIHCWNKELENYEHISFSRHGKLKQIDEEREIAS